MAGPVVDLSNVGLRNVVVMAINPAGELEPVYRDGNALRVSGVTPPTYQINSLANHTFLAQGPGHTFGPTVDVDTSHSVHFWVINNTATNNVVSVQLAMYDGLTGTGFVADSPIVAIPGGINPDSFYFTGLWFSFDFNSQNYEYAQIFRSCIVGVKVNAPVPAQSITVGYRGLAY